MRQVVMSLIVLLAVMPGPVAAGERVDLELVLLADASRSIDDVEIRLQRQGYAAAMTHPDVLAAIGGGYERRIAVTYVEWGDEDSQEIVVPWTVVDGPGSAAAFAKDLLAAPRIAYGPNAIGSALAVAQARAVALAAGTVINGLAILCPAAAPAGAQHCSGRPVDYDLEAAFAALVTGGPGSFVITVDGDARFAEAVRRKLLLEIAGAPVSDLSPARLAARGP